jgi:hypothetical protein
LSLTTSGTLPAEWGASVSWNTTTASAGFDACVLLDVGQNALGVALPLSGSSGNARMRLSLYDNLFSGPVPASFASLSWLALAYNPLLVGARSPRSSRTSTSLRSMIGSRAAARRLTDLPSTGRSKCTNNLWRSFGLSRTCASLDRHGCERARTRRCVQRRRQC